MYSKGMIHTSSRSRKAVKHNGRQALHRLENLEPRKLLTTLVGGDVFQFIDVDGQVVRIHVTGDAIVELIGGHTDGANLDLGDLAGIFISSDIGKAGTTIGAGGIQLLGNTPITDGIISEGTINWSAEGSGNITLQSLASRADGSTFSFNIVTVDVGGTATKLVQVLELNTNNGNATVIHHIQDDLPAGVTNIRAAAIDPLNPDDLYFVAESGGIDRLYSVDVVTGVVTTYAGSFGETDSNIRTVQSIVFDQVGADTRLLALLREGGSSRIIEVDTTNTSNFLSEQVITFAGGNLNNLSGMALLNDTAAADNTILAVEGSAGASRIMLIDLTTGAAVRLGSSIDQSEEDLSRGNNLQGLTFNPTLVDPFTGGLGAFLAVDATTDELVFINPGSQGGDQLFAIYVSHAGEDAAISVSTYLIPSGNNPARLTPFAGVSELNTQGRNSAQSTDDERYDLKIIPANGNDDIISFDSGIGGVYIGAKQWVLRTSSSDEAEPLRPLIEGSLFTQLGVFAPGQDLAPDLLGNIGAGIYVAPTLLEYLQLDSEELIGAVSITDPIDPNGSADHGVDAFRIDVRALAARATGETYGFNVQFDGFDTRIQLLQFDVDPNSPTRGQATVIGHLQDVLPQDFFGNSAVFEINAAAFDPVGGELYFVATVFESGVFRNRMFRVDVDAGNAVDIANSVQIIDGNFGDPLGEIRVDSIVFDQIDPVTSRMMALVNEDFLAFIYHFDDFNDTDDFSSVNVFAASTPTGMALPDDDPNAANNTIVIVEFDGIASRVLEVNALTGTVLNSRLVPDLAGDNPFRGQSMMGLTFNPILIDPTTGLPGALIASDIGTDELFLVSLNAPAQTLADRLMGFNLDNIAGLAVKRDIIADSAIVVIDSDNVNQFGVSIPGDQIALLNSATGHATDIANVYWDDGIDEIPLDGVLGMGFGDLDFTGDETLYAIYTLEVAPGVFELTLGTIDIDPLSPTFGEFTPVATLDATLQAAGVRTMAFAPAVGSVADQQALFIIGQNNIIYEVDALTGDVVAGGDAIEDALGNTVQLDSIVFNRFGTQLLGHDRFSARLVDIDLSTLGSGVVVVGQNVATEPGTVRPTVGGLAYDFTNNRFLAADNAPATTSLANEGFAAESAVLMQLRGISNDTEAAQNIDRIFIGGKVTGQVYISGSIDTFYAGVILTGQTLGQGEGSPQRPGNFYVGGDIRNLISGSSIGTNQGTNTVEPQYLSGFDLVVRGQLGQMWAQNSFIGSVDVHNDMDVVGLSTPFREIEGRQIFSGSNAVVLSVQAEWLNGRLYDGSNRFYNDSFDTAQPIGTIRNPDGTAGTVIFGELHNSNTGNDGVDFYSIALMAGQTIELQTSSGVALGLFDPDGRLVATNFNAVFTQLADPFRYTSDRPGEYRIAIARANDRTFTGSGTTGVVPYIINVSEVGELAIGGIRVDEDVLSVMSFDPITFLPAHTFQVRQGDFGAFRVGGTMLFDSSASAFGTGRDFFVWDGSLRSVHADGNIGRLSSNAYVNGPITEVRGGGIGLIRNFGDVLIFDTGNPTLEVAFVDGDIQLVDAAGNFVSWLSTNSSIGVIRAGEVTSSLGATDIFFRVNADGIGAPGVIDLIDVEGNFGTIGGGPGIDTGPGGNVRYMRIGGTIFQDTFFIGGTYSDLVLAPGESHMHIDDGGGRLLITPGALPNPDFNPNQPVDPDTNPEFLDQGFLTIRRYGIRGSGGSVLINVESSNYGIVFESFAGDGTAGPVEVSRVAVNGEGQSITTNNQGRLIVDTESGNELKAIFKGVLTIDVLDIVGGQFTEIFNSTGGELVSIEAESIGLLRTPGMLGLPKNHTGQALSPREVVNNDYPFDQQTTGIRVSGDVVTIRAGQALGNLMIDGNVWEIYANNNGVNTSGGFEGVAAPIYVGGNINYLMFGEGIAPSGSGSMSRAGLYVIGTIGTVENQGIGSDIWGDVISQSGIGEILLHNGAIINTQIVTFTNINMAAVARSGGTTISSVDFGRILITGPRGGIIGSTIQTGDIGNITVRDGFGIIYSTIRNLGSSTINNINAAGFGILGTNIQAASSIGNVTATGNGQPLTFEQYTSSVIFSLDGIGFHPIFNNRITQYNDINLAISGSNTFDMTAGQIALTTIRGLVNAGMITAHKFTATTINFANRIAGVRSGISLDGAPTINGLSITTGAIARFNPRGDVSGLNLTVAGPIRNVNIRGSLLGDSTIRAVGANGNIVRVNIQGDLIGSIFASGAITTVRVHGDMVGDITANGLNLNRNQTIRNIRVDGNFYGSLDVNGNVGNIRVMGELGDFGDVLFIDGNLQRLQVGNQRQDTGALIAHVIVTGNLNQMQIVGSIIGEVHVGGNMRQLRVNAHAGTLGTDLIDNLVWVEGNINNVRLNNGNLGALGEIVSWNGNINQVVIRNGSLFGTLAAPNGIIRNVNVTGSDLGGLIHALAGQVVRFHGSILTGGAIIFEESLRNLRIDGDVQDDTLIQIGDLQNLRVGGDMAGDLMLGERARGVTQVNIFGDWTVSDDVRIDAESNINVRGNMTKATDDSVLHVANHLNQFRVNGNAMVDLIVDGGANQVVFGSLMDSVVVFGHDVSQFTVQGAVNNSLVQVGVSAGDDGVFAAAPGEADTNETSRIAGLGQYNVGSMANSILAVTGSINRLVSGTMVNSSASAGLSLGSQAIREVLDDTTRLANLGELNDARSGDDRVLYWGDINQANINGNGLQNSYLTAGVNPGAAGDFSSPDVVTSVTGGQSVIGRVNALVGAGSRIVTDAGINNDNTTLAGGTISTVGYTIANITTDMGNPLQANLGSAMQGSPLILAAGTLTITVNGPGTATVFDNNLGDGTIDAVVLSGTTGNTRVTITGNGAFDLARLLTEDDANVGQFIFDGDFVGDGTAAPDLWIDGPVGRLQFNNLANSWNGQIGGDVNQLVMMDQGSGRLMVGGTIGQLNIATGSTVALQNQLGTYAGSTYNTLTVDGAGNVWAHVGNGVLHRINPSIDGPAGILQTVNLFDTYSGQATPLLGLDFLGATPYAVARLYDNQPTQAVGTIADGLGTDLRGLAVNSLGQVYAVDSTSGIDQLVRIDPETGEQTVIGTLRTTLGNFNFSEHMLAMTFNNAGQLIALVSDQNGLGAGNAGVALVQIQLTPDSGFNPVHRIGNTALTGQLLNGGGETDAYTGLVVATNGTIYTVRRTGGTTDELLTINPTTGAITSLGDIEVDGGGAGQTSIRGIGFDEAGNLVAFDNDGVSARLIYLAPADLGDASAFQEMTLGSAPINPDIDVFAMGRSGAQFRSYAFDTAGDGTFYINPIDPSDIQGRSLVLGTIDPGTGAFQRLLSISDADGSPLQGINTNIPLAADAANDTILIVTAAPGGSQLVSFDTITNTFSVVGPLVDSLGRDVNITALDFDDNTGELIGLDIDGRRVVLIDPTTGDVGIRTTNDVVAASLTDLAFDPITGSFFSYQAAQQQFVQLKGTVETDAGGIIAVKVNRSNIGTPYFGRIIETSAN